MSVSVAETIDQTIAQLVSTITDLPAFCRVARNALHQLEERNTKEWLQLEAKSKHLANALVEATAHHARAMSKLEEKTKKLSDDKSILAAKNSEMVSLRSQVGHEEAEIRHQQRKIDNEKQRQSNAAYDLIPFHGIFSAIISGDAKRAIPLYSQIDGIVSAIEDTKKAAEQRLRRANTRLQELQNETRRTESEIAQTHAQITVLKREIIACKTTISECDRDSKVTGRCLTSVRNLKTQLKLLGSKVNSLQDDVELVDDMNDHVVAEECLWSFRRLNDNTTASLQ